METMKYLKIVATCLLAIILYSCTDDVETRVGVNNVEGIPVILSLSYKDIMPNTVVVARAEDDESSFENVLSDLQIFIFDSNGDLKGYRMKTQDDEQSYNEENLKQDGTIGNISVKTTTGASYIFAIANATGATYSVSGFPANVQFDENRAQNGEINFTLEQFKQLYFQRIEGEFRINDYFLMSGSANNGEACTISKNENGNAYISNPTSEDDKLIKLRRVVSKVTFNVTGDNFEPTGYDFVNIPLRGSMVKGEVVSGIGYEDFKANYFTTQARNTFTVYLPENMQLPQNNVTVWNGRETNSYNTGEKVFTNAPANGTYVVLRGTYETENRIADVEYTIHLGNFTTDVNNYDNERNYRYTYNVNVQGVDKIVAEAHLEQDNPGAEGIVIDYTNGKAFTLDSHYEYCVMQFHQNDIQDLKQGGRGYLFQVETFGNNTEVIMVDSDNFQVDEADLNGVDIDWITFAKGGTYSSTNTRGGIGRDYTATNGENLLTAPELLSHLYSIADDDDEWDNGVLTYTCYVNENYYSDRNWSEFVNIEPRRFYIANNVYTSSDGHSIHATVAYSLSQYSIQTFYDRANASTLIAYGCEMTNDEEGKSVSTSGGNSRNNDAWNGRSNMIRDIGLNFNNQGVSTMKWSELDLSLYGEEETEAIALYKACMSRNRDLDRDGDIESDEIRWYVPTIQQYTGFWIGEPALATNARLYQGSTSELTNAGNGRIHYYSNTYGSRTFWSEEGMAFGDLNDEGNTKLVRCIRTLKSNDVGATDEPYKYYTYTSGTRTFNLAGLVDESALRQTILSNSDLPSHNERDGNNHIRETFQVAEDYAGEYESNGWQREWEEKEYSVNTALYNTTYRNSPCYNYRYHESGSGWRIPNQREFCLMGLQSGLLKTHTLCRTHFSYTDYRLTYTYDGNVWMIQNSELDLKFGTSHDAYVRCVRDVSD